MFATNSNLVLGSFYNDFFKISCVFLNIVWTLRNRNKTTFLCVGIIFIIYLHIYIVFCCAAFYTLLSITVIVLLVFVLYISTTSSPNWKEFFNWSPINTNIKFATCLTLRFGQNRTFFSLLLSLSIIQELTRFLWQCLIL